MLRPRYSTQFKKDYKLALRRGRDERLFIEVLDKLLRQEPLPARHKESVDRRLGEASGMSHSARLASDLFYK